MKLLTPPSSVVEATPEGLVAARVMRIERGHAEVFVEGESRLLPIAKKQLRLDQPVTGDWVHVDLARSVVVGIAERATCLRRRAPAARGGDQVVVANFDVALIVMGLDGDFSIRRAERYVALVGTSGASSVVFLTKAAAVTMVKEAVDVLEGALGGVRVHAIDVVAGFGGELAAQELAGKVGVVLGSSGSGKSTLTNYLVGEEVQETQLVRARDQKGRHTTVRRELFLLPNGGAIIDTPGLREVAIAEAAEVDDAFDDVTELALGCRFGNCQHQTEPDCAVLRAIVNGELQETRVDAWRRLTEEGQTSRRRGR